MRLLQRGVFGLVLTLLVTQTGCGKMKTTSVSGRPGGCDKL
jgi:hypothetical protein